jgi:shikimate dehydrogenase
MLDVVTDLARDVGAVNTVTFGHTGRVGHNTDVEGIVGALADEGVTALAAGEGCVLGGGATAASALAALSLLGDRSPVVVLRDASRAGDLLGAAERLGLAPSLVPWADAAPLVATARVVVSTVPASASGQVLALLTEPASGLLLDVVYDPWPTAVALGWQRAGGTAIGGLTMLVHQAVGQVRLMTGHTPSVGVLREAGLAALRDR